MLLGLPMMLLELSLGQLFQRGDIGVFRGIHPRLYGVGLASVFSAFAINIFYTYLIAIAGCYFFAGFVSPLPWSIQRTAAYQEAFCEIDVNGILYDESEGRACMEPAKCADDMYITEE
jgi:SNF family Na+-dependent transporter